MENKISSIIDGNLIAEKIKDNIVNEIIELEGKRPNLAIILVGDREDSRLYVEIKEREAKKVGIDTHVYKCIAETSETEIFAMIDYLNKDEMIDAILVQLPLPKGFDTDGIILAIDPEKDVDRFHPDNLEKLFKTCDHDDVMPPVYKVVVRILSEIDFDLKNKTVGILANSDIFGKGLGKVMECRGANSVCISLAEKDFTAKTSACDVLISAIGKPRFIKKEMIKQDAILIDIGINRSEGKVCGDFDLEDVLEKALHITPVPGGVGPMTVAMLFENTLELFLRQNK